MSLFPRVRDGAHVGFLGGSFNPPHLAHAMAAQVALGQRGLDHLYVIPTFEHAFGKNLVDFDERLAMCRLSFADIPAVKVLDVERHLPAPSYTVQTMSHFLSENPTAKPVLIFGSDILEELEKWREPDRLRQICEFFVLPRHGYAHPGKVSVDIPFPEVSSSAIREALANGEPVPRVMHRDVLQHIESSGLYVG